MPSPNGQFSSIPLTADFRLHTIQRTPVLSQSVGETSQSDLYTPQERHIYDVEAQKLGHRHQSSDTASEKAGKFYATSPPQATSFPEPRHSNLDIDTLDDAASNSPRAPLLESFNTTDSEFESGEASMGRRKASPEPKKKIANGHSVEANGNGNATSAEMESSLLEQRRKHPVLESPTTATHTAHLMGRSDFSLDDPVSPIERVSEKGGSRGFTDLPEKDRKNFLLLVLLYFLQGVPMGLAMGSVPFLLKQHVSYTQMGVFSLASYPYSIKLLWSPIVDAVWSPKVGRRKSWILPIQTMSGLGMLWLSGHVEGMMAHAAENDGANVWGFTWWWFGLVLMCATQDIAVDGWALTLLSPENISYASTAQTVGLTAGHFLTNTIFLAFNSKDFANKWFRSTPSETGLVSLSTALSAAGWLYLIVTVGLALGKREELTKNDEGVWDVYKVMVGILKLRNVQTLIVVHLIAKIGFQANDSATMMKLLDKGFGQDNLSLTVLIDFPFEIGLGYYVGKWSSAYGPMRLWSWAFTGRLCAALLGQFVVSIFPASGVNGPYMLLVIFMHVFSTFMNTVMFVAVSAFHAKIADPVYGGTYMTLLATVSNLGGTFPKFFVLKFIDMFTVATCTPPSTPPTDLKIPITAPFSCVLEPDKARCIAGGGSCNTTTDGYYIMNILCIIVGLLTFYGYIRPSVHKLEQLPIRAWRLIGR